jgi:diguanylate cyclase (GGDEF)-like protein
MLSIQQYAVVEAGSGQEALTILESNPDIQLVVSDYYMPDMDGFELARRIRRLDRGIRVIGISSSTDRQTSAGFLKAGAHDFVARPFVLEELQCRIASNVETLTQLRQLKDLAARDYLTGLYNRRHFFERGSYLVTEARGLGVPVSVALLDIDHFKQLNDQHGHDVGDKALAAVAKSLNQSAARGFNLIARVGGEEFAILFPGADLTEAARLCEVIRQNIAREPLALDGETLALTVSLGVTEIAREDAFDACLGVADRALYAAKQGGRNRVCTGVA